MRKLIFSDTNAFYRELKEALKQEEPIEVITHYKRYSEIPEQLKTIFELEKNRSSAWTNIVTNAFIPDSMIPISINYSALYVIGTAGGGALVGGLLAGPVGCAVGAGIGCLVGGVAVAISTGKHHVNIKINPSGELGFTIYPA